jgi:hypothetical protein
MATVCTSWDANTATRLRVLVRRPGDSWCARTHLSLNVRDGLQAVCKQPGGSAHGEMPRLSWDAMSRAGHRPVIGAAPQHRSERDGQRQTSGKRARFRIARGDLSEPRRPQEPRFPSWCRSPCRRPTSRMAAKLLPRAMLPRAVSSRSCPHGWSPRPSASAAC